MYIIRLDDASEYSDVKKWNRIEKLLNNYNVKPIVGIIPNNEDDSLVNKYSKDTSFWNKAREWEKNGWIIALHGYNHKYISNEGGLNPVHNRSEFAGVSLDEQKKKIQRGLEILKSKKLSPKIFFAPSHTFDDNTIIALKKCSDIQIISDTIANNIYYDDGIFFIPQQSGRVRWLPFKIVTFCYHPNEMEEEDFISLEKFIKKNQNKFQNLDLKKLVIRKRSFFDILLSKLYFVRKKI